MSRSGAALLGAALPALLALGPHSSREPLPSREVERGPVLPKGWTELSVGADRARADEAFGADGVVALDAPWRLWTGRVAVRFGAAPGFEIGAALPVHHSRAFTDDAGFGATAVWTRIGLVRAEAPNRALALELGARSPLGDARGEVPEGSLGPTGGALPLTTGTGDLVVALLGRREVDGLLLDGRLEGVRRFAGRPAWADGWFAPGDALGLFARALLQAGPIAVGPFADLAVRGPVRAGPTRRELAPVPGSAGPSVELGADALVQLTRAVELELHHRQVALGPGDAFVYVPSVQPPRATRLGATARIRW